MAIPKQIPSATTITRVLHPQIRLSADSGFLVKCIESPLLSPDFRLPRLSVRFPVEFPPLPKRVRVTPTVEKAPELRRRSAGECLGLRPPFEYRSRVAERSLDFVAECTRGIDLRGEIAGLRGVEGGGDGSMHTPVARAVSAAFAAVAVAVFPLAAANCCNCACKFELCLQDIRNINLNSLLYLSSQH